VVFCLFDCLIVFFLWWWTQLIFSFPVIIFYVFTIKFMFAHYEMLGAILPIIRVYLYNIYTFIFIYNILGFNFCLNNKYHDIISYTSCIDHPRTHLYFMCFTRFTVMMIYRWELESSTVGFGSTPVRNI